MPKTYKIVLNNKIDNKELLRVTKNYIRRNKRKKEKVSITGLLSELETNPIKQSINAKNKKAVINSEGLQVVDVDATISKKQVGKKNKWVVNIPAIYHKKKLLQKRIKKEFGTKRESTEYINKKFQKRLVVSTKLYIANYINTQIEKGEIPIAPPLKRVSLDLEETAIIAKSILNPKKKKTSKDTFISGVQITAILQQKMSKEMPSGPVGGPPLSSKILTNRTRRFLDSVKVQVNYRTEYMRYFYMPLYSVHDKTARSPSKQIERNLREIAQSLFGRQFRILRDF